MEYKIIIFIISFIIYIYTSWLKAKKKKKKNSPQHTNLGNDHQSLQDLLDEFKSNQTETNIYDEGYTYEEEPVNYETEAMSRYQEVDYETPRAYTGLSESDKKDEHMKPYRLKQKKKSNRKSKSRYALMLQNKSTARDAVILNEIFNTKKY